jgi:hypothetical protein
MYKKNHMNSRLWPQFIRQYACAKCFLPTGIFGIVYIDNKGGHIRIMYKCSQNAAERKTEDRTTYI